MLIAVAEVVGDVGYAQASIRQVASKAGISTKTFYELFPDKEAAFLASYASVDVVVQRMRDGVADAADARGVLHAGLTQYLETLAAGPGFARALVVEALATTDAIRARRRRGLEQFAEALAEGLRRVRGPESRDILESDTDRELLIAALGGVNELCVQHLSRFDAPTLTAVGPVAQTLLELVVLTAEERDQT